MVNQNQLERRDVYRIGRRQTDGQCQMHEQISDAIEKLSTGRETDSQIFLPRWIYIASVGFFITVFGLYITLSIYNMSTFKDSMGERLNAEVAKSDVLMTAHNVRVDAALKASDEKYKEELNRIYVKTDDNSRSLESLARTVVKIETLQNKVLTTLDRFQDSFDRLGHEKQSKKPEVR